MKYKEAIGLLRAYFTAGWDDQTPVAYDDTEFDIPSGEAWTRLNIRHIDGEQASTGSPGSNLHRRVGILTVQIFTPQGDSSVTARQLADAAADLFIGQQHEGIKFSNTTIREVGPDGAGWYQINVLTEFRYDRIA